MAVKWLLEYISENTISTTRQTLFENSIERYMEKVKKAGIEVETATTLSMKRRQGVNATVSSCKDIDDFFTFNVGLTQRFPRAILTSASNFIDINGPSSDQSNSKATCIQTMDICEINDFSPISDKGQSRVATLYEQKLSTLAMTRRELRKMISDEKEQRKEENILLKSEIENLKVKITENEKKRLDLVCDKKVESFMQSFSLDTFDSLKTAGE